MGYQGTELDRRIAREHFAPLHVVQRPRPVRLRELGRKATPESAAETHVQVNGLWVPKQNLRDATIVSLGAQSHPRGLAYELDALTRARLCHLQHPHWVMSGWTAAAQWGLEYFVDDAGTSVLAGGGQYGRRILVGDHPTTENTRARADPHLPYRPGIPGPAGHAAGADPDPLSEVTVERGAFLEYPGGHRADRCRGARCTARGRDVPDIRYRPSGVAGGLCPSPGPAQDGGAHELVRSGW